MSIFKPKSREFKESGRSREERWSDWLQTIGTVATSFILIGLTLQQMRSNNEDQQNRVMADYVKQMTELRVKDGLSPLLLTEKIAPKDIQEKAKQEQVKLVARENTLNAARQLDGKYKGRMLKYLYDTKLIGYCSKNDKTVRNTVIDINQCENGIIDLDEIEFKEAVSNFNADSQKPLRLWGIDLRGASLVKADLKNVILIGADLSGADLRFAKLNGANLEGAMLEKVRLNEANLNGAVMVKSKLLGTNLKGANLKDANLEGADLRRVDLDGARLEGANLRGAFYSKESKKETKISEEYKKVMRLCPDGTPDNSDLDSLSEVCVLTNP